MAYLSHYESPLGGILLASDGEALTGLWFDGQDGGRDTKVLPVFDDAKRWLDVYFSGRAPDFIPQINPRGTPFQQRIWAELMAIPYGRTDTYGAIARRLGCRSAQAVGGAVGHNPIALIIPCHRVLGADGSLTGYAWGLERKVQLLRMEGDGRGRD